MINFDTSKASRTTEVDGQSIRNAVTILQQAASITNNTVIN